MNLQETGEMIKTMRKSRNMSQAKLAKAVGFSQSTVNMWEHGERRPNEEAIEAMADVFNVPKWSLLYREDELKPVNSNQTFPVPTIPNRETYPYTPARAMVPIVGNVRCGPGGLAYYDLQGAEGADVANPQEYFYLRAVGDSMEPRICAGDLVLVHIQEEVENGELAVVIVGDEEGMLKKFTRNDGAVILQSFNPAYQPLVLIGEAAKDVRIVGKAVKQVRTW